MGEAQDKITDEIIGVNEPQNTIETNQKEKENKKINKLSTKNDVFIKQGKEGKEESEKKEGKEENKKEEGKEKKEKKEKLNIITKYSNLDPSLFTNEFILDYKCISCELIPNFEKATEILCCGSLICEKCLNKLKDNKKGCPICNTEELKTRNIKKENKIFYKSFKSLLIKCPYKCDWTGMWVDLDTHLMECKLSYRECKYNSVGCEYVEKNQKVKEHEQSNDKYHLDLALKFIKDNKIEKKKIKFELGETVMTTVHPHIMTYKTSFNWNCDGRHLEHGCYSINYSFPMSKPRFRCTNCDFDLCDECIIHYLA